MTTEILEIRKFAEDNHSALCNPDAVPAQNGMPYTDIYITHFDQAIYDPWLDPSGRIELSTTESIDMYGLEKLLDFCSKACAFAEDVPLYYALARPRDIGVLYDRDDPQIIFSGNRVSASDEDLALQDESPFTDSIPWDEAEDDTALAFDNKEYSAPTSIGKVAAGM